MTGAGGYIGAHVVVALADMGASVVAVDRPGRLHRHLDDRVTIVEADIFADPDGINEQVGKVDACLHLAWKSGFVHDDPVHMLRLSDHFRFLDALARAGTAQVAVMGTVHEIGYFEGMVTGSTPTNPRSLYGVAKNALRESMTLRLEGQPTVFQWLRCFYIHGDDARNRSIFTKITEAAESGATSFPFTSGRSKFDFIEVDALGRQIAAATMQTEVDGIINCCSGVPVSLGARVEEYIKDKGYSLRLDYGAFADRVYDSPAIWGDPTKINQILAAVTQPTDPGGAQGDCVLGGCVVRAGAGTLGVGLASGGLGC